jgi:hypothetical protein
VGIGGFLGDIGNGIKHGLDNTVEGLNVVDRYINPFHEEQTITPGGEKAAAEAAAAGHEQSKGVFAPGLEDTMSGMRWLYSNGISQPISTAALVGKMDRGNNDPFGDPGRYFKSSNWTRAWHAANHISPGQALLLNPDEAEQAMNSPLLYYKPGEAYLPPGFSKLPEDQQQKILQEAGMPAIGNRYIQKYRENNAWYKYGSGSIDFAAVMFADPTTHGLGAIGKSAKLATVVKAPKAGWSTGEIDAILGTRKMQTMHDFLWRNKDNPQLINNTTLAQKSGMGPRFGALVSHLQTPDELNLFLRVGMGDVDALEALKATNANVGMRLRNVSNRLSSLDLMRSRYSNFPSVQQMIDIQMEQLSTQKAADAATSARYSDILANRDLLDELHFSRWGSEARAVERTAAQNKYRAGPGRGSAQRANFQPGVGVVQFGKLGVGFGMPAVQGNAIESGVIHSTLWHGVDFFSAPLTVVRALKNANPRGYIKLDTIDRDSITELRAHLARIPGMRESTRADILNKYLKTTTEHERKSILEDVGRIGSAKVAQKHGLTPEDGENIWRRQERIKQGEIDRMKRYSAGVRSPEEVASGQPLHIDEFLDTGGKQVLEPFTASRIMNGHVFQDLDTLDKVLTRHAGKLKTLKAAAGNSRDAIEGWADYANYLWKFSTLFRLGYIPRVLGDDLASQWASVGTAAMALRVARGAKNAFENGARWAAKPALVAREQNALNGAEYAQDEMKLLRPQIRRLDAQLKGQTASDLREQALAQARHQKAQARLRALDPADRSPRAMAIRNMASQRASQLNQAQMRVAAGPSPGKTARLVAMKDRHDMLSRYHDLQTRAAADYNSQYQKVIQGNQPVYIDGVRIPAAFEGAGGAYARDLVSADESVGNLFATNKQLVQGNLERSFDHGGKGISAAQDAAVHLESWAYAINRHIAQDPLSKLAIRGKTVDEMADWMKSTAQGIAYRKRLPQNLYVEDIARSAKYEVDQYLTTPELRMKALEGPDAVTPAWLDKAFPKLVDRPDVHTGQVGLTQLEHAKALDRIISKFYKVAATMPADRMSRHPLFNQFYEGHVARLSKQWMKQTGNPLGQRSVADVEAMANSARQLALRDTRALVFDIAHRSDAAAAMRFLSPFFSATAEAFQRWGRVIADKPQVAGYAGNWYNSPAYLGAMQDLDGNKIDGEGYTYLPEWQLKPDGSPDYSKKPKLIKTLVPKNERYIVTRLPKWFVNSPAGAILNVRESGGGLLLSQNSINMVTQGDPWFNPGVGPIVQIPVNELVKDKPSTAKLARDLGILPFGVQGGGAFGENPFGRALNMATPAQFKNFITSFDTSDQRYQQIRLQIMNRTIYDFTQKHDRPPTKAELGQMQKGIADRTRNYWLFSTAAAFTQPFATQRKDPYQFYYDQYNALRRNNPMTADDEFLNRFGESLFIFASETTKSQGIPPTTAALNLAKEYGKEIAANPELAALIIGPEGKGPFSPEAYRYELNNPLVPGGSEMMRGKLTADQALEENQRRLGWAKYTKRMNSLTADLHKAGFQSFSDEGAEDFQDQRQAWTKLYAEPLYPDGTENPYYNEAWSKDFYTQDARKYERMIPALTTIANSRLADRPERSDLRMLQQYLGGRKALLGELNELQQAGLPHTLNAGANNDLRYRWAQFVDGLIEESPKFGDLYHRYLSRDMGVNAEEEVQQ